MIADFQPKQQPATNETVAQGDPLGTNTNIVAAKLRNKRNDAYRLLAHAQKLLTDNNVLNTKGNAHRTRGCFAARHFNAEHITLKLTKDPNNSMASIGGIQTCGSIWTCSVCGKRIAVQRGKEIGKALKWANENGYIPIMMTLTASHHAGMSLADFKAKFKAAWRYMGQSRKWRNLKADLQIQQTIKAVEVTHGRHGWHYHYHALLFLPKKVLVGLPDSQIEGWVEECRSLWLKALGRNDLTAIGQYALDVTYHGNVGEQYLSKLGLTEDDSTDAQHELAGNANKNGKGLTIWAILRKSRAGDDKMDALYCEYARAMQGENWITWSHGFKGKVGVDEIDDTVASDDENNDAVEFEAWMTLTDEQYRPVRRMRAYADLLEIAAATRDKDAVLAFIADLEQLMFEKYPSREKRLEQMRQQYSRLDSTLTVQRKYWNKKGEHPPVGSPMYEQIKEWKKLKSELKAMGELS